MHCGEAEIGKCTLYRDAGKQELGNVHYVVMWGSRNWEVYLISCITGKQELGSVPYIVHCGEGRNREMFINLCNAGEYRNRKCYLVSCNSGNAVIGKCTLYRDARRQ